MMHQLVYTLTSRGAMVLPAQVEDPNLVSSLGYVPGSAIWGAAGSAYAPRLGAGGAEADPEFRRLFLRGALRFLNAYPLDAGHLALLPAPISMHRRKDRPSELYDLACQEDVKAAHKGRLRLVPIDRLARIDAEERAADDDDDDVGPVSLEHLLTVGRIDSRLSYHHARAKDRRKGRATERDGALYVYESIDACQSFQGRILGEKADLDCLLAVTGWGVRADHISLGKGRAAGYGGDCTLAFTGAPQPAAPEWPGSSGPRSLRDREVVVTLLSPLVPRPDSDGGLPLDELNGALAGSGIECREVVRSYCRIVRLGGYNTVWNLPRPQVQAYAAGSVFVVVTDGTPSPAYDPARAEIASLGLRTHEGMGRFALDRHGSLCMKTLVDASMHGHASKPGMDPPDLFWAIAHGCARRSLEEQARLKGLRDAAMFKPMSSEEGTASSQLSRFRSALNAVDGLDQAAELRSHLKEPARAQFKKSRSGDGKSLLDIVAALKSSPESISIRTGPLAVQPLPGDPDPTQGVTDKELARLYLLALVDCLMRRKRAGGGAA